jgi:serine/threonine protein kinase
MGAIVNDMCCISRVRENENVKEKGNSYNDDDRNLKELNDKLPNEEKKKKFYPSAEIKSLPLNTIKLKLEPVDSLDHLPISNRNIIRKQLGDPLDDYKIIKKLGQGTYGTVYKVKNKKTGIIRAMKIIPKNFVKDEYTDEDIIQEVNILTKLDHPHIIKLYEFYIFKNNIFLINEFCTEGDLSGKLSQIKIFPEFIVKILMIQIFNAVVYLKKNCVIHGDLKLENIMVDSVLKKDELPKVKGTKFNFIQSLLEDEKEISSMFKERQFKRSNSLKVDKKGIKKISQITENINLNKEFNNENMKSLDRLMQSKKTGKSSAKSSFFKNSNIIEANKKSSFNYLNKINFEFNKESNSHLGYNSDNDTIENENEIKKFHSIKNEDKKIENDEFKTYEDKFIDNKFERSKTIKTDKQNIPCIIEHTNSNQMTTEEFDFNKEVSNLKKTLAINSMKLKNFELKLIDFGCAKIFSKNNENFKDIIGTLVYCSPEVLKNNYSNQCDVWSCGVIMYVLLSGHFPFFGKNDEEIEKKILSGKFTFKEKYFRNVSEKAKDLIRKCLIYDKNERITPEEALKHEFFADDISPNNIFLDEIDNKKILLSLKNFSQQSKIYQIVLTFLSHNFADKVESNKLKTIFLRMDLNLDGKLTKDELAIAFKEAGMEMQDAQLNQVIKSVDFNGNGSIEYEEFIRVTLPKEQLFTEVNLKHAFDMFDLDKKGMITLNNFKEILGIEKVKDKKIYEELLKQIPLQKNENMNFDEFKNYIYSI